MTDRDDVDPLLALELDLVDFARSFREIGEAFLTAADAAGDLSGPERAGLVTRHLVDRYILIDQMAVSQGLAALVGYLARRTGRTPREVHEALFKTAPSDAWWHDRIADDDGDKETDE